jgi:FtsZ-binding cell division protein ZapB
MSTTSESLEEIAALRDFAASLHSNPDLINKEREAAKTIRAAAARLEELERENAELRKALKPFAWQTRVSSLTEEVMILNARAALAGSGEK